MSYTCDKCGNEFEQPIMVDSGGEYGGLPHKEPASPCCECDFDETENISKVSEERMKLRIEYSRETDLIFSDNIPAYADWLENKLALRQTPVKGSLPLPKCKCGQNALPYKAQIEIDKCSRCGNGR